MVGFPGFDSFAGGALTFSFSTKAFGDFLLGADTTFFTDLTAFFAAVGFAFFLANAGSLKPEVANDYLINPDCVNPNSCNSYWFSSLKRLHGTTLGAVMLADLATIL